MDIDKYSYRIVWSEEDQQYVGLCAEFPLLSWLASSKDSALEGISELVGEVLEQLHPSDEPLPEPLSLQSYSGKFMVRVPPEVHRKLVVEAAEARVSLNRMVSHKLAQ